MDKKYGIYADFAPTTRQRLFEAVKNKAVKCTDRTQLFAAIYPYILYVVCEYTDNAYNITQWQRAADSFRADLYGFRQALSSYVSAAIPPDRECLRNDILNVIIDMAVAVARVDSAGSCVQLSPIMARYVDDL